jgi:sulfate/thiosulfate transport system permease protein
MQTSRLFRQFSNAAQTSTPTSYGDWGLRAAAFLYLGALILVPILVIFAEGFRGGIATLWEDITRPAALSAIWLSVWTAALMAVINVIMGTLTAYVLHQYNFPGKNVLNAIIDLPFAIPTLVTGIMLVLVFGPQTIIGLFLENNLGFRVVFAPPGIVLALLFIGYPFVIRTVQPVLEKLDINQEEAAQTLGASPWTVFRRVTLPLILPAMITGGLLSFARALGEFGSLVIVAGNIPMRSQVSTVYIYAQVEQMNLPGAAGVSMIIVAIALGVTVFADVMITRRKSRADA